MEIHSFSKHWLVCTVRLKIIGNDNIKNVGKYEACMVSK